MGNKRLAAQLRKRIAEIEEYMRSRDDAGGLLDELLELEAELRAVS